MGFSFCVDEMPDERVPSEHQYESLRSIGVLDLDILRQHRREVRTVFDQSPSTDLCMAVKAGFKSVSDDDIISPSLLVPSAG